MGFLWVNEKCFVYLQPIKRFTNCLWGVLMAECND